MLARRILAVLLVGAAISSACSSSDSGSGDSTATDFATDAAKTCERIAATGCSSPDCVEDIVEEHTAAKAYGCEALHSKWVACLAAHDWQCTTSDAGWYDLDEPDECDPLEWDYDDCSWACSYGLAVTNCNASCVRDGKTVAADCPSPSSCTCKEGPKAGTSFQSPDCTWGSFVTAIFANCT